MVRLSYFCLTKDDAPMTSSPNGSSTVISTKGQVILPKAVRERRQWTPGTRLVVEETAEGVLLKAAPVFAPTRPEEVFASLVGGRRPKSLEEMETGIAAEVKRRHARHRY
jgi:AbrB family looped-hinge helix DNA binding protein